MNSKPRPRSCSGSASEAGQFIIDNDRFDDFHIPAAARPLIRDAWEKEPPSIYGRFDLMYNGNVAAEASRIQREYADLSARSVGDSVVLASGYRCREQISSTPSTRN